MAKDEKPSDLAPSAPDPEPTPDTVPDPDAPSEETTPDESETEVDPMEGVEDAFGNPIAGVTSDVYRPVYVPEVEQEKTTKKEAKE